MQVSKQLVKVLMLSKCCIALYIIYVIKQSRPFSGESQPQIRQFNTDGKPLFFLGILSQENNRERRDVLRKYVISQFDAYNDLPYDIKYTFVIDRVTNDTKIENEKYKDILFMNTSISGYVVSFGFKLQWFYKYIVKHYPKVEFIGRIDDDVFLCVKHLLLRVKYLDNPRMFYGWKTIAPSVDEQFFIVGRQIIDRVVKREFCDVNCNRTVHLIDSNWGTVALQAWLEIYEDIDYVYDNRHIYQCLFRPNVEHILAPVRKIITVESFCQFFVSFHKADEKTMEFLYTNTVVSPPKGVIIGPELHNQLCDDAAKITLYNKTKLLWS